MITAILIDTNTNDRSTLKNLISQYCPNVNIIGEAENKQQALRSIQQLKPRIIFLNVDDLKPGEFEVLAQIDTLDINFIFTSYSSSFAVKAFNYNSSGYLLKPLQPLELIAAVNKVSRQQTLHNGYKKSPQDHKQIALKINEGMVLLRLKDIIRLEADGHYTTFYTVNGERIIVSRNIKDYYELLPENTFSRPHQSHMVNLDFVKKVLKEDGGYILMEDEAKIPIARRRKELFISALTRRSLN